MKEFVELLRSKGKLFKELRPLDPKEFGIKKRITLYEGVDLKSRYTLVIWIERKSRFLQKDAKQLIELVESIQNQRSYNYAKKILLIKAPLCSKAKELLQKEGFRVFAL